MARLGVNIDHVATVRQARGESFPDPVEAAKAAIASGADGITAHLREDRRHIQDRDIERLKKEILAPLNMEMACSAEITAIAEKVKPAWACLVPENRKEITTEGGLDVARESAKIAEVTMRLKAAGINVSLFIDPTPEAVKFSKDVGADAIELHTGTYARLFRSKGPQWEAELKRLGIAARQAQEAGLLVNAGHGIDYENVGPLLKAHRFNELNIGFAIIARALFAGIGTAVKEMKSKLG